MSQRSGMLKLAPLLGLFSGTEKRPWRPVILTLKKHLRDSATLADLSFPILGRSVTRR
jgi:hypothetical protein